MKISMGTTAGWEGAYIRKTFFLQRGKDGTVQMLLKCAECYWDLIFFDSLVFQVRQRMCPTMNVV